MAQCKSADLKTLQDLLGHSGILVTADTYTSVLPAVQRKCANDIAQLVLAAAHRTRTKIKRNGRRSRPASQSKYEYLRARHPRLW